MTVSTGLGRGEFTQDILQSLFTDFNGTGDTVRIGRDDIRRTTHEGRLVEFDNRGENYGTFHGGDRVGGATIIHAADGARTVIPGEHAEHSDTSSPTPHDTRTGQAAADQQKEAHLDTEMPVTADSQEGGHVFITPGVDRHGNPVWHWPHSPAETGQPEDTADLTGLADTQETPEGAQPDGSGQDTGVDLPPDVTRNKYGRLIPDNTSASPDTTPPAGGTGGGIKPPTPPDRPVPGASGDDMPDHDPSSGQPAEETGAGTELSPEMQAAKLFDDDDKSFEVIIDVGQEPDGSHVITTQSATTGATTHFAYRSDTPPQVDEVATFYTTSGGEVRGLDISNTDGTVERTEFYKRPPETPVGYMETQLHAADEDRERLPGILAEAKTSLPPIFRAMFVEAIDNPDSADGMAAPSLRVAQNAVKLAEYLPSVKDVIAFSEKPEAEQIRFLAEKTGNPNSDLIHGSPLGATLRWLYGAYQRGYNPNPPGTSEA